MSRFRSALAMASLALFSGCGGGSGSATGPGTGQAGPDGVLSGGPALGAPVRYEVSDQYLVRGIPEGARTVECLLPLPVPWRAALLSRVAVATPLAHEAAERSVGAGGSPQAIAVTIRNPGVSELTVALRYTCDSHPVGAAVAPGSELTGAELTAARPYLAAGARDGVTPALRDIARPVSTDYAGGPVARAAAVWGAMGEARAAEPALSPEEILQGLWRVARIPCRTRAGVRLVRDGAAEYRWLECYLGGTGWVPVDVRASAGPAAGSLGGVGPGYIPYGPDAPSILVDGAAHTDWQRRVSFR